MVCPRVEIQWGWGKEKGGEKEGETVPLMQNKETNKQIRLFYKQIK